jgi:prepilin-type N-terminal cleavage/methylation domain-containing protein
LWFAVGSGQFVDGNIIAIIINNLPASFVHAAYWKVSTRMKSTSPTRAGFTLVEIMIVVAIIGVLAAIAVPNFVHARTTSQMNACINNLRQIDGAKQQWGLENNAGPTARPRTSALQPYLGRGTSGTLPYCPLDSTKSFDGSYVEGDLQTPPVCRVDTNTHVLN